MNLVRNESQGLRTTYAASAKNDKITSLKMTRTRWEILKLCWIVSLMIIGTAGIIRNSCPDNFMITLVSWIRTKQWMSTDCFVRFVETQQTAGFVSTSYRSVGSGPQLYPRPHTSEKQLNHLAIKVIKYTRQCIFKGNMLRPFMSGLKYINFVTATVSWSYLWTVDTSRPGYTHAETSHFTIRITRAELHCCRGGPGFCHSQREASRSP